MAQKPGTPSHALLRIQQVLAVVFLVGALVFPGYILYRHGLNVLPVYDRGGNVVGHANYFLLSLGMSVFALAISWLCYKAAQWALQQLGRSK
jgi:hypothetical protein